MTTTTWDRNGSTGAQASIAAPSRVKSFGIALWQALESLGRHRAATHMRAEARRLAHSQPETSRRLLAASTHLLDS